MVQTTSLNSTLKNDTVLDGIDSANNKTLLRMNETVVMNHTITKGMDSTEG